MNLTINKSIYFLILIFLIGLLGLSSCCDLSLASNEFIECVSFVSKHTKMNQNKNTERYLTDRLLGLTSLGRVFIIESYDSSIYGKFVFQPK